MPRSQPGLRIAMRHSLIWRPQLFKGLMQRGARLAEIELAEATVDEMRSVVHVITGTLKRSLHVAPNTYDGRSDKGRAQAGEDLRDVARPSMRDRTPIQAGSWVDYALYENARGGSHAFADLAFAALRSRKDEIIRSAFQRAAVAAR